MDEQKKDDQLELIYSSFVLIQDVALKTYREWGMIEKGGEKGSERSVFMVRHDDDDDDDDCCYKVSLKYISLIYIYI